MKCVIAFIGALAVSLVPLPAAAQLFCATNFGSCPMNVGMPGTPCFCATPNGPVQGITQGVGGGPARLPSFCCTPAGRIGPFNNTSVGPGQVCQVMGPTGPVKGQACF